MVILEITNVSKKYGGVVALSDVSFFVEQGQIVGVIGANGAGKTTLFSIISGFYSPTSGAIKFRGEDITRKKPFEICRKGIVRTFQIVRPFENMSVLTNVMVGKLFGKDRVTDQKRAQSECSHILDLVGLSGKAEAMAGELGLIDKKRLELARSLATNADVILLDEVMAGLTPVETAEVVGIIRNVHSSLGLTLLMVEHVMKAVVALCDRIVVLHYGRKIAEGTPGEITENSDVVEAYWGESIEE